MDFKLYGFHVFIFKHSDYQLFFNHELNGLDELRGA
jgi:hypothetical protein